MTSFPEITSLEKLQKTKSCIIHVTWFERCHAAFNYSQLHSLECGAKYQVLCTVKYFTEKYYMHRTKSGSVCCRSFQPPTQWQPQLYREINNCYARAFFLFFPNHILTYIWSVLSSYIKISLKWLRSFLTIPWLGFDRGLHFWMHVPGWRSAEVWFKL